jgi:hypothetical protein
MRNIQKKKKEINKIANRNRTKIEEKGKEINKVIIFLKMID